MGSIQSIVFKLFLLWCVFQLIVSKITRRKIDKDIDGYGKLGLYFIGLIFGSIGIIFLSYELLKLLGNDNEALLFSLSLTLLLIFFYILNVGLFENEKKRNWAKDIFLFYKEGFSDGIWIILIPFTIIFTFVFAILKYFALKILTILKFCKNILLQKEG